MSQQNSEKRIPIYNKVPFKTFKQEAVSVFLEIHGQVLLQELLLNTFINIPALKLTTNAKGISYLDVLSPFSHVDKNTSYGDKLNEVAAISDLEVIYDDTIDIIPFLNSLGVQNTPVIKETSAQTYLNIKDLLILSFAQEFMGFCEECFISDEKTTYEFFGKEKLKELMTELLNQIPSFVTPFESLSFFNFLQENKEDIRNSYFMSSAQVYLNREAHEEDRERFEVLLSQFLTFADIPYTITIANEPMRAAFSEWAQTQNIEDIMIFCEFYPMSAEYAHFEWDKDRIIESKIEAEMIKEDKIKNILGVSKEEELGVEDQFDKKIKETQEQINSGNNLQKIFYDFFNSVEGDKKEILVIDNYNNRLHCLMDDWGRLLNVTENFIEDFPAFYAQIETVIQNNGHLLFINHYEKSMDLYGFSVLDQQMTSMSEFELHEFLTNNSPMPPQPYETLKQANISWNNTAKKGPKL